MLSYPFKICDPVHGFIRFGEIEKQVIDSTPFQRLRYIRQMGVAYLVYPGATHTRFEHSLGVMELVTRLYHSLTSPHNRLVPLPKAAEEVEYWLMILRIAALCHDMGHPPLSHTAEKYLLPDGGHEGMTRKIICSAEMHAIWKQIGSHAEEDILKLSIEESGLPLTPWESLLTKVITEDSFGADRMDYLIRDGHYTGVGYGHFDYHQLIDSMRILKELTLGITASGMQSVESLWIARYMMYERVYQHPTARVYSNHMRRFIQRTYTTPIDADVETFLEHTDYTLLTLLAQSAKEGEYDARCLLKRAPPFSEILLPPDASLEELQERFGEDLFIDQIPQKEIKAPFPVYGSDHVIRSCFEVSPFLRNIPPGGKPICVYAHPKAKLLEDYCGSHGSCRRKINLPS
ncbi:MAG: HD domain-containing protein, partial [Chlamydiia bacterium]|nr:HD domain-containing protein [Chlamydiia bacterium]